MANNFDSGIKIKKRERFSDRAAQKSGSEEIVETDVQKEPSLQTQPLKQASRVEPVVNESDQIRVKQEYSAKDIKEAVQTEEFEVEQTKTDKKGDIRIKKNWDAYSLPEYIKKEDTQIKMDIKDSPKEPYYKIKRRLSKLERIVEVLPFWKSGLNVFSIVFSIFSVAILSFLIFANFGDLKSQIPLFFNQISQKSDPIDKSILLVIPIASFFFNVVIIRLNMMIFNFDKKLVYSVNVASVLFNLLSIIGMIQVISLVLY